MTHHPYKRIETSEDPALSGAASAEPLFRQASVAAVDPLYFDVLDAPGRS